mgnify:CR=1 FL=1|nr:MAG TPA: hypothetical protein [Caudoviricetes sp.]
MINLNDMPEEFYDIIFGDVTIEEFAPNIVVECNYKDSTTSVYGRIIVHKELAKITLINLEIKEYEESDPSYPIVSVHRLARKKYYGISEILKEFKCANDAYGYNKDIKIINIEDK